MKLVGNTVVVVLVVLATLAVLPFVFIALMAAAPSIGIYAIGFTIIFAVMLVWNIFVDPGMKAKDEARQAEKRKWKLEWELRKTERDKARKLES